MIPKIKICGLSTAETLNVALDAGADMVGFVFFEPSPRHLSYEQAAALAEQARGRAEIVALSVDADDARLAEIERHVRPDWLQFHGTEAPERLAEIGARFAARRIKAIKVSQSGDLAAAQGYIDVADMLLYDAKAPKGAVLPGGNGLMFDWTLLEAAPRTRPMMLSGGLSAENVADAIAIAAPDAVDVSSGVERAPGVKDADKIRRFIAAARGGQSLGGTVPQRGRVGV